MADVNKTIEISMKADLKQLLAQFQKMPGVTKKEAQKMVSGLQKELRQAQKATERVAKSNRTAMKQVAQNTKIATKQVRNLRTQTRELGGSFNAMGDVLSEINPELGGVAMQAELAGDGFRAFSRIMATGNPILMGLIGLLGAGAAAYTVFTYSSRKAEERNKELEEALKSTNEELINQEQAAQDAASALGASAAAVNNLALDYIVLTGAMTEKERKTLDIEKAAGDLRNTLEKNADDEDTNIASNIVSYNKQLKALNKRIDSRRAEVGIINIAAGKDSQYNSLLSQRIIVNEKLNAENERREKTTARNNKQIESQITQFENLRKATLDFSDAQDKKAAAAKKRRKAEAAAAKNRREQEKEDLEILREKERIEQERSSREKEALESISVLSLNNEKMRISLMDNRSEKIEASLGLELNAINLKIEALEDEQFMLDALALSQEEINFAKEQEALLTEELILLEEQKALLTTRSNKMIAEQTQKAVDNKRKEGLATASLFADLASNSAQLIKVIGKENKDAAMVAFRLNQVAAIASITIDTAAAVMKVAPNPLAMGAVGALGAVQAAVVLATPPPEMHMGGMINKGGDTQTITALKGEAILDRASVRRIGGEEGLRKIQQGQLPKQEVIVRTPFKHFDNYTKLSIKRNGALSKLQRTRSIGAY